MKKVWVLERFISAAEMKEELVNLFNMRRMATDDKQIEACNQVIEAYQNRIDANPDGYWLGYQGKIIYKQFCQCAHETMRNLKGSQFRVVKAEIEDDAKQWLGYKNPEINDGVLKYLYATL